MKHLLNTIIAIIYSLLAITCYSQNDSLIPNYNSAFYSSVLPAAKGVAMPFLVDQKYFSIAGANVVDSTINYAGSHYHVHNYYLNPATNYYVASSQYSAYDISSFSSIWPTQCPNILYNSSDTSFNAQSDCVGYLTRLLSVTGNTTTTNNAYLTIINTVHAGNTSHFAAVGYVSTAYSFAVAFPTFPTSLNAGWQYVAGNVESSEVNTYNHTIQSSLGTYNGTRKGGFAQALPGDILAFGYSASSSSNGHVMVMETSPHLLNADSLPNYFPPQTLVQATDLLSTYNMYSVPVFDCSGKMAHFRDSRALTSGIGHGKLLLLTALTDDAPMGFIFDTAQVTGATLHFDTLGTSVYAISIGRFVAGSTTDIEQFKFQNEELQIYPNPGSQLINLSMSQFDNEKTNTIEIYNAVGACIHRQVATSANTSSAFSEAKGNNNNELNCQIDVSGLAEGVYTLSIINYTGVINRKVIIIR
jgi:hypothetical protein